MLLRADDNALAHMSSGPPRRDVHVFDSFEGLPEPEARHDGPIGLEYSKDGGSGRLQSIGRCVSPLENVQRLLGEIIRYPLELTHYHVGWFQDTVPKDADSIERIALLRLDGDWYESTKICLDGLGHKVGSGGIVVLDDYGKFPGCRKATDEYLSKLTPVPFLNHIDPGGRYFIVP